MLTAITLLSLAASAFAAGSQFCDPTYQCRYHYQTDTDLWYWDLSSLCHPHAYSHVENDRVNPPTNFTFNICGLSDEKCTSSDPLLPSYGVAVQNWDNNCALVGEGQPIFMPYDLSNPQTGGINVSHLAAPVPPNSPIQCAPNNQGVTPRRSITFLILCDSAATTNTLNVLYADQEGECHYVITAKSKAGCGIIYDGADSKSAQDKEAGERSAEGGAVFGFMVLGAILFVGGWTGVHYYQHRELPFSIPGVGNLSGGPRATASGASFSGSGGGFGSSAAGYSNVGGH